MKKKNIAIFSLLFIMLVVSGCASYDITQDDAYAVATNAALGTPPPPKYQTAAAAVLSLTLTPTPNGEERTVDVHIRRLRKILEEAKKPRLKKSKNN